MSSLTHAALSDLSVDENVNARIAGRGSEPEFAASIEVKGIIEPLVVRIGPKGKGFKVTNGSKRFDALHFLKDAGKKAQGIPVTEDFQVPIIVRQEEDSEARETSLMANIHSPLHPVDEHRAYLKFYHDMRNEKLPHDDAVATIARRFGSGVKHVEQRLALGNLDETVLNAWVKGQLDEDAAQAFTLCPDKKSQTTIFAKLVKDLEPGMMLDAGDVKGALKIGHNNAGRLLNAIGIDAYEKRGGKVTRDLFGADHVVSDVKLAKVMADEAVAAKCQALLDGGWSWAIPGDDINNKYSYGRVDSKAKPTSEETAKLNELDDIARGYGNDDAEEVAEAEAAQLRAEIAARGFTTEQKGKSGCFVELDALGKIVVDYGRVNPEEKKAVAAQQRKVEKKKKVKSGQPEEPKEISGALAHTLSATLTTAAAEAVKAEPSLALTFLIAALLSNSGQDAFGGPETICISNKGMLAHDAKTPEFADAYERASKMRQPEQLKLLAEIVGTAFDFQVHRADQSPLLHDSDVKFLCEEIDAKALNKALRAGFDAQDYFDGVPKSLCLAAITEAINADEARKIAGKPKGEIAKFAVANVPKTGWLPPELRTAHYDGPAAKAPAKKKKK